MKIVSGAVTALLFIGVVIGVWRWLGDDQPLLSPEWFESSTQKFEDLGDVGNQLVEKLPDPESVSPSLPELGDDQ